MAKAKEQFYGTGRRKSAVARVYIKPGKGNITVTGKTDGNMIVLKVQDTGAGMDEQQLAELKNKIQNEDTTSFGLVAAYKRLKLLYGEEFRFDIVSKAGSGTSIKLSIPRKANIENETIL